MKFEGMFSEEREQKLKERLLGAFELARTAKLKPKATETEKSKSWFSGLIDQRVELVIMSLNISLVDGGQHTNLPAEYHDSINGSCVCRCIPIIREKANTAKIWRRDPLEEFRSPFF
jgi:hypothetical protein